MIACCGMVQLNGTYYVGASNDSSSSDDGFDAIDAVCVIVLFLSWVGVFSRYGVIFPSFVFAILFTLLVASGTLDRRATRAPSVLSIAMVVLWFVTLWFMPYGIGPGVSSLGAGGLVPFFARFFNAGPLPVLFDGLIGAAIMFVIGVLAVIVIGLLTGKELLSPTTFITSMARGLFLGTTGSLVEIVLMLVMLLVFFLIRRIVASRLSDGMLVPQLYTSGFGSGKKQEPLPVGLALAAAAMIVIIFF